MSVGSASLAAMFAIRISQPGGPEVLQGADVDEPSPGPGQITVGVEAAGINYIDTYHRTGLYPMELPFTPGLEGAGRVTEIGSEVSSVAIGDRVAWTGAIGSYAERVTFSADSAVAVPDSIETETAAAVMLQGLTAHYLVDSTYPLSSGDRCLIHAGAGGVGLLLIQMAKMRGAEVFTTVGSASKAELAAEAGADHVINYRETDFGDAIEAIVGKKAISVVYDGVGKDTFDRGLEVLAPLGMMVTFGNASGPVDPVSPLALSGGGSLFLTRPTLFDYIASRSELERRCSDLFSWVADGRLDVRIGARFPLAEAEAAHRLLEGRTNTGKIVLTV